MRRSRALDFPSLNRSPPTVTGAANTRADPVTAGPFGRRGLHPSSFIMIELREARPGHQIQPTPTRREQPPTFPAGRPCMECGHTLSKYNPRDRCFRHRPTEAEMAEERERDEADDLAIRRAGAKRRYLQRAA